MQDYKSLHVAVMICATLVNTGRQLLTGHTISSTNPHAILACYPVMHDIDNAVLEVFIKLLKGVNK